ncbi:MAG: hypothetical protein KQI35_13740 [Bacteroidetes bacterium]|nr:hypothetical protein [Bacteroidota bacterium]
MNYSTNAFCYYINAFMTSLPYDIIPYFEHPILECKLINIPVYPKILI